MNRSIRLVPLFCLAAALGCVVPSIEELAQEHPVAEYTCTEQYGECPEGRLCVGGRCLEKTTLACIPREQKDCYSTVGECRIGKKTCGANALYGACVGGVAPVAEVCNDSKDNDCDGKIDTFAVKKLVTQNAPDSALAAAWVQGADRALLATVDTTGALKLRSLGMNDVLDGDTFQPSTGYRASAPAIATKEGIAVVAWIEQPIGAGRSLVMVAKVDKNGKQISGQRLTVFSDHDLPFVTEVSLAISKEYVLVALATSSSSREPLEGESVSRETWVTTFSADLSIESPISHQLAIPIHRFGLHVAVDGDGSGFVVAYEDNGVRYTIYVTHTQTGLSSRWLLTRDTGTHSPFVINTPGDKLNRFVFYARNRPSELSSEIVNTRCDAPLTSGISCQTETVLFRTPKRMRRAWMGGTPGGPGLSHALFSWQEWTSAKTGLSFARFDSSNVTREKEVAPSETFGESFFITPDGLLDAVFLQNPTPAEPATPKDAYLQPLCFF